MVKLIPTETADPSKWLIFTLSKIGLASSIRIVPSIHA